MVKKEKEQKLHYQQNTFRKINYSFKNFDFEIVVF